MKLSFHPATPDRWKDVIALFGERGASGGCWCMWWRLPRAQYEKQKGPGNRTSLKKLIDSGRPPGILAYDRDVPVGWCALAPRDEYLRLANSRILQPVDERPVWSVTCFFVNSKYRKKGLSLRLLKAAARFAAEQGGTILEGYPIDASKKSPDAFAYTGLASPFLKAGFVEITRRSSTRPIMRRTLKKKEK